MAKGCVRTDNMAGTLLGKNIASVKFKANGVFAEIENGNFVVLGDYLANERNIREGSVMAVDSTLANIALVAGDEVDKAREYNAISEFVNEAGVAFKAYILSTGDEFSLSADAFEIDDGYTTPAVGGILEAQVGTKALLKATQTGGSTKLATLIAIEDGWYVFRV